MTRVNLKNYKDLKIKDFLKVDYCKKQLTEEEFIADCLSFPITI